MTKWCGWCLFYLLLLRGLRLERDAYKVEDWRKSWPRVVEVDRKFVCWCKCRWRGEEKQFSPCNVIIAVTLLAELCLTKLHSWTRTDMQRWRRNRPPRWASYPPRVIVQVKLDNSSGASLACQSCWRQDDATNKSVLRKENSCYYSFAFQNLNFNHVCSNRMEFCLLLVTMLQKCH